MEPTSSKRVKSDIPPSSGRRAPAANGNTLRKHDRRERNRQRKRKRLEPQSNQEEFILRDILQEELRQGKLYYLIDWEGIDPVTGRGFEHTWEPAENANREAVRDWQYKKKIAAEENADKDSSLVFNTQSSEPIRGPKRRKTTRQDSSTTPKQITPKPTGLSRRQVSETPSLTSLEKQSAHAEIKDSYEEDLAFSAEKPSTKKPFVEISLASKDWDPSEYRQVSIYSQDTQPLPSYSDSDNSSQHRRSSPIRFFQPSSRPRNPFEEIPSDDNVYNAYLTSSAVNRTSSEPAASASLVIPDSQDYLATASYDPSLLPSTGTASKDSDHSQPDTQAHRGDNSLLAVTEDPLDDKQLTLTTDNSPSGSLIYRPTAVQLQDSESAESASYNQESISVSSTPAQQISGQVGSLNLVVKSPEKSSLESGTALHSCSIEHTQPDSPLVDKNSLSGEQEVSGVEERPDSSDLVPLLSSSPTSQRLQPLSPPRDSEDEGYSEPTAGELIDSQSIHASQHSSQSEGKVPSQTKATFESYNTDLQSQSIHPLQINHSEDSPSHLHVVSPAHSLPSASPVSSQKGLLASQPAFLDVNRPCRSATPKRDLSQTQNSRPTNLSRFSSATTSPKSILQSVENQDSVLPCTPGSRAKMEGSSSAMTTSNGSKDTRTILMEARLQATAKRAAERAAARSASTMPATPPPPPVLEHPLPLREAVAEKLIAKPVPQPVVSEQVSPANGSPPVNISPQPSPVPEEEVTTRELSIAMLEEDEYVIPLPLVAHTRDVYVHTLRNHRNQRLAFFDDSSNKHAAEDIEGMLDELAKLCDHQDLISSDYSTQREMSIENVAKYAETISTKCIFIAELIDALRDYNKHLVILSRRGRMQEILHALLFWHGFEKLDDGHTYLAQSNGSLRVSILPSDEAHIAVDLEAGSIIIAFSPTSHASLHSSLRANKATPSHKVTFVSLVITHSIEHLNLCFGREIRGIERTWALVTSLSQIQDKVGKAGVDEYPPPDKAAYAVARFVIGGREERWPIPQVPIIQGIELDLPSTSAESAFEVQPSGSTTQSWDVPMSQVTPLTKRHLINDDNDDDIESPKRQRLSPLPSGFTNDSRVTHVSVSTETSSSIKLSSQFDHAHHRSLHFENGSATDDPTVPLRKKVDDLEDELRRKEASESELRASNKQLEERLQAMELSLKSIQPKYQEALNDRSHFEKEITSALQLQAKLREKADAKDEMEQELKEARMALSSSAIPEIARFNKLKEEMLALKDKIVRHEKRAVTAANEQAFFSNQYQIASAEANQANLQNKIYEEELKALRPRCAANAVEIHQIYRDSEISQHLEKIKELTEENAEYERELERKTDELKALMNGRRGATRGTSVPRSPRIGAGTMSPGTNAVRRVIAHGSRGNSPAPNDFGRGGQFGEALQGVATGRWGTHLQ